MTMMDLIPEPSRQEVPSFRFATVTAVDPVRVRLDGEAEPVPTTPVVLARVEVGQRVYVQLYKRQLAVLGVVGGEVIPEYEPPPPPEDPTPAAGSITPAMLQGSTSTTDAILDPHNTDPELLGLREARNEALTGGSWTFYTSTTYGRYFYGSGSPGAFYFAPDDSLESMIPARPGEAWRISGDIYTYGTHSAHIGVEYITRTGSRVTADASSPASGSGIRRRLEATWVVPEDALAWSPIIYASSSYFRVYGGWSARPVFNHWARGSSSASLPANSVSSPGSTSISERVGRTVVATSGSGFEALEDGLYAVSAIVQWSSRVDARSFIGMDTSAKGNISRIVMREENWGNITYFGRLQAGEVLSGFSFQAGSTTLTQTWNYEITKMEG